MRLSIVHNLSVNSPPSAPEPPQAAAQANLRRAHLRRRDDEAVRAQLADAQRLSESERRPLQRPPSLTWNVDGRAGRRRTRDSGLNLT